MPIHAPGRGYVAAGLAKPDRASLVAQDRSFSRHYRNVETKTKANAAGSTQAVEPPLHRPYAAAAAPRDLAFVAAGLAKPDRASLVAQDRSFSRHYRNDETKTKANAAGST